jgi:ABC-2 type transport system permease protein
MTVVFSSTFSSASYYRDQESGFLRVILASPVPGRAATAARASSSVLIGTAQAMAVIVLAAPFVDLGWQWGIPVGLAAAAFVLLLINATLAGLATALASRINTMQGFHLVMNLALFPLLFFSGAFFPLDGLPGWFRVIAMVNPLTYAVDGLLLSLYADDAESYIGLGIDLVVLVVLAGGALGLGLARRPRLTWSGR